MEICVLQYANGVRSGTHRLILAHAHKVNIGLAQLVLPVVEVKFGIPKLTVVVALKDNFGMELVA